jgi:hypothetical protein
VVDPFIDTILALYLWHQDIIPLKIPSAGVTVYSDVGNCDHFLCVLFASWIVISPHSATLMLVCVFNVFADVSTSIDPLTQALWLFSS